MNDRTVKLVSGYLPNIDYPNKTAHNMGLPFRFAIVLDSFRQSKVDMFFDAELFFTLFHRIFSIIEHDTVTILFEEEGKIAFGSLDAAAEHFYSIPEEDREPFVTATLSLNGTPTGLICAEWYYRVGGPAPYHDSYTYSIYRNRENPSDLADACRRACAEERALVTGEFQGETAPKISVWKRIINVIR